jgi:hypothetical protein
MGQCNHCTYKRFKKEAKAKGEVLTQTPARWGMGGVEVFMHPKDVSMEGVDEDDERWEKYHVAWFMELTNECAC